MKNLNKGMKGLIIMLILTAIFSPLTIIPYPFHEWLDAIWRGLITGSVIAQLMDIGQGEITINIETKNKPEIISKKQNFVD